jgi:hypothetical protein
LLKGKRQASLLRTWSYFWQKRRGQFGWEIVYRIESTLWRQWSEILYLSAHSAEVVDYANAYSHHLKMI